MKTLFIVLCTTCFAASALSGQNAAVIFSLQEKSDKAEAIMAKDHQILLKLYDSDLEQAMKDWYGFLSAIETYSDEQAVDLNGVKMWMNVFFNPDGSIAAIGYHPKRGCKNMDWPVFNALLKEFSKQYRFPKQSDQPFSHYAAALWPTELLTGRPSE